MDQLLQQFGAGQTTITADDDLGLALGQALRANGAADPVGIFGGQGVTHHATDVVGAEDVGGKFRGALAVAHCGALLQSQEILVFVENVDIEDIGVLEQRVDPLGGLGYRLSGGRRDCSFRSGTAAFTAAARQTDQALGQGIESRYAETEGFDALARREFFEH